jgi:hypothetical protein
VAVACATQRGSRTSWTSLVHHWVVCHKAMAGDRKYIKRFLAIRYEDFVRDPDAVLAEVLDLIGLAPSREAVEGVRPDINRKYFDFWGGTRNPLRILDRLIAERRFEESVRMFGYSLRDLDVLERPLDLAIS